MFEIYCCGDKEYKENPMSGLHHLPLKAQQCVIDVRNIKIFKFY